MKLQLDFDSKTITIEDNVNLGDFVSKIKKIIPDWKGWDFKTNTIISNWSYPYTLYFDSGRDNNGLRYDPPYITTSRTTQVDPNTPFTLTSGIHNVELN